jgi:hypothetical protein
MMVETRYLPRSTGNCANAAPVDASSAAASINPRTIMIFPLPRIRSNSVHHNRSILNAPDRGKMKNTLRPTKRAAEAALLSS